MKKIAILLLLFLAAYTYAQDLTFTYVNARNTTDGVDDYYEADIYIEATTDFILGSGQVYFTYNSLAFGENIKASGNFEYLQPTGCILAEVYGFPAYKDFIDNDNTTSRVSTAFQQGVSSGTIGTNNVTAIPKHLFSIKIKYVDVNEDPTIAFESGGVYLDQFYTACGPASFGFPDCTNEPGVQLFGDTFDSTFASLDVTWTGLTSSDWTTESNWDRNALPATTNNIIIPNVGTTAVIGSGDTVQMNDLTVETGASFSILEEGSVTVAGDFTTDGTVSVTSTSANSGVFIVKGTSNGTITYERGGLLASEWSTISAPVSGQSIKEFVENAANDIRVNTTVTPHRYAVGYYDDSKLDGSKWIYYTATDLATNALQFEEGKGYAISRASNGTVTFTGTLGTASITETVMASTWNAIGNPYTAFLPINENGDVNFIVENISKFDASNVGVYVWDNTQNKYVANSLVTSESSLAPGQGFFIRTTTGVSDITFNEAERITQLASGGTFSKGTSSSKPSIELSITSDATTVKTDVKYLDAATEGLDPGYDLGNFGGATFDVYTHLLDDSIAGDFTIQSLPTDNYDAMIIPIGLEVAAGKEVRFNVNATDLPEGMSISLEDKETGVFNVLTTEGYTVTMATKLAGYGRFYLHTQSKVLSVTDVVGLDVNMYQSNTALIVEGLQGETYDFMIYNTVGAAVYKGNQEGKGKDSIQLPLVETGVYIVKLTTSKGVISKKLVLNK